MGVPGIDEATAMKKAVIQVQTAVDLPLSIDSVNFEAIENGLKKFCGPGSNKFYQRRGKTA
jgi:5-methyltetrahydrofolate--homocysteine methyltransferase